MSSAGGSSIPFKVVMLGDSSVGKTCLVNRLVKNDFNLTEPTLA